MKKFGVKEFAIVIVIMSVLLACNFPFVFNPSDASTGEEQSRDAETSEPGDVKTEESGPEGTPDPRPAGMQEGLGNYDSYRVHISLSISDSTGRKNDFEETMIRDATAGNTYTRTVNTTLDPSSSSEPSTSVQEAYNVGLVTCSGSDESGWTYEETSQQQKDLTDIFQGMVDIIPQIDNPQYVGVETVNGVEANHFTLMVEGIDAKTGAVTTINEGHYWLSVEVGSMVKYTLILEVHTGAEDSDNDEWTRLEATEDITDINAVTEVIELPAGCVKE